MTFHDAGDQKSYLLPLLGPGSAHVSRTLKCNPGVTFRTSLSEEIAHASSMLKCLVDETFRTSLSEKMRMYRSCSNVSRVKHLKQWQKGKASERIYLILTFPKKLGKVTKGNLAMTSTWRRLMQAC